MIPYWLTLELALKNQVKKDPTVISNYFASLKLKLNINKTKVMHFHRNHRNLGVNFPTISLAGSVVENVSSFKYLGVTIDQTNIDLTIAIR